MQWCLTGTLWLIILYVVRLRLSLGRTIKLAHGLVNCIYKDARFQGLTYAMIEAQYVTVLASVVGIRYGCQSNDANAIPLIILTCRRVVHHTGL